MEAPVETPPAASGAVRRRLETLGLVLLLVGVAVAVAGLLLAHVMVNAQFGYPENALKLAWVSCTIGYYIAVLGAILFVGSLVRLPAGRGGRSVW